MSAFAPGTFASQQEKDCAAKTGYKFVEPMVDPDGTKTNSASVRQAYKDCVLASQGMGDPNKKFFTPKNIIIGLFIIGLFAIGVIVGGLKLAKVF